MTNDPQRGVWRRAMQFAREWIGRPASIPRVVVAIGIALVVGLFVALGFAWSSWRRAETARRQTAAAIDKLRSNIHDSCRELARNDRKLSSTLAGRKETVHQARMSVEELLAAFPEDRVLRQDLAEIGFCEGLADFQRRKIPDAVERFEQARDAYEQLLLDQPEDADFLVQVSDAWVELGKCRTLLETATEARSAFEKAIEIRARVVDQRSSDREVKRKLASARMNRAISEFDLGRFDEARETLDKAIGAQRELLAEDSGLVSVKRDLAKGWFNSALLADGPRAARDLQRAAELFSELQQASPLDTNPRFELAVCYRALAGLKSQPHEEASSLYRKAMGLLEPTARSEPEWWELRAELGALHADMGELALEAKDLSSAVGCFSRGAEVLKPIAMSQAALPIDQRNYAVLLRAWAAAEQHQNNGNSESARIHLDQATTLLRDLADRYPQRKLYQEDLQKAVRLQEEIKASRGQ